MFRKYIAIFFLALFALTGNSYAVENFEVKTIAVVDVKRITEESLAAKTVQTEVGALKNKYADEIKDQDKKLQAMQKDLISQKKALSQEAFEKQVNSFKAKVDNERQQAIKKQKILEAAYIKSLELIRDETLKVVNEIVKEKNIDMVIPTSQLLYSKEGNNITNEVLERLNKKLTKVDINIENTKSDKAASSKSEDKPADKAKEEKKK